MIEFDRSYMHKRDGYTVLTIDLGKRLLAKGPSDAAWTNGVAYVRDDEIKDGETPHLYVRPQDDFLDKFERFEGVDRDEAGS